MKELNYEKDISIDDSALDVEWLQQASLTLKYCQLEADARKAVDDTKAQLDIVEAELDKEIRNNPEKFDLPKITESAIKSAILVNENYINAKDEYSQAQYELNMAQAAVRAIYAKKDALENLVRLHGQQYFAGPSVPRDLSKEWESKQRQKSSNSKVKIKRRK